MDDCFTKHNKLNVLSTGITIHMCQLWSWSYHSVYRMTWWWVHCQSERTSTSLPLSVCHLTWHMHNGKREWRKSSMSWASDHVPALRFDWLSSHNHVLCLISLSVHLYRNVIVFCEWELCAILSYLIIVNANSQTLTSLTKVIYVQKIVAL